MARTAAEYRRAAADSASDIAAAASSASGEAPRVLTSRAFAPISVRSAERMPPTVKVVRR
jgi:hypothetical protein